jgi:DNA-directed RNA polymerase subunit D
VDFLENDTPLFDEIIAHWLGLIPLTTDLVNYNMRDQCSCGGTGCTLCQTQFSLSVHTGEGETRVVTTADLNCLEPKVIPTSNNTIIAKMGPKSKLEFEAEAYLGLGKTHAKFMPVCAVGYKFFPTVEINNKPCATCQTVCAAAAKCHKRLFPLDEPAKLVTDYQLECTICRACEIYCPHKAIKVKWNKSKFVFTIEGKKTLPIKEVIERALEVFREKLAEFRIKLADLAPELEA